MANKRQLKKAIGRACGTIAGVCIGEQELHPNNANQEWDDIIIEAALLQVGTVKMVSKRFGKKVKEYATPALYRKARREFHRENEKAITTQMNSVVGELAKRINALQQPEQA